jgi:hypothetical protein
MNPTRTQTFGYLQPWQGNQKSFQDFHPPRPLARRSTQPCRKNGQKAFLFSDGPVRKIRRGSEFIKQLHAFGAGLSRTLEMPAIIDYCCGLKIGRSFQRGRFNGGMPLYCFQPVQRGSARRSVRSAALGIAPANIAAKLERI